MLPVLPLDYMKIIFEKISRFFRDQFTLAVLDETAGRWQVKPESKNIAYLKAENANGRHILVKPNQCIQAYYLLVDDLNLKQLNDHHKLTPTYFKKGRMVVETSPGNYQIWIQAHRPLNLDEKRYWLKRMHSDPGADPHNRWGRCPGFRNRKKKHKTLSGQYPLAKLIWVDWKNRAVIPEAGASSLQREAISPQPRGGVCQKKNMLARSDYEKGDESATDFAYALALCRRGYSKYAIEQRIVAERQSWKNHAGSKKMEDYLHKTISKVFRIISFN